MVLLHINAIASTCCDSFALGKTTLPTDAKYQCVLLILQDLVVAAEKRDKLKKKELEKIEQEKRLNKLKEQVTIYNL